MTTRQMVTVEVAARRRQRKLAALSPAEREQLQAREDWEAENFDFENCSDDELWTPAMEAEWQACQAEVDAEMARRKQ